MYFDREEALRTITLIHDDARSVQLQKLSHATQIKDVPTLKEWLKKMGKELNNYGVSLGSLNMKVWRCKIGQSQWHYGWTATDAALCAYDELSGKV